MKVCKHAFAVAFALVLGTSAFTQGATADEAGKEVLERVARAYAALEAYGHTGRISVVYSVDGKRSPEKTAATPLGFLRPRAFAADFGRLAVVAKDDSYRIVNTSSKTDYTESLNRANRRSFVTDAKSLNAEDQKANEDFVDLKNVFNDANTGTDDAATVIGAWASSVILTLLIDPNPVAAFEGRGTFSNPGTSTVDGVRYLDLRADLRDGPSLRLSIDSRTWLISEIRIVLDAGNARTVLDEGAKGGSLEVVWNAEGITTKRNDVASLLQTIESQINERVSRGQFKPIDGDRLGGPRDPKIVVPTPTDPSLLDQLRRIARWLSMK